MDSLKSCHYRQILSADSVIENDKRTVLWVIFSSRKGCDQARTVKMLGIFFLLATLSTSYAVIPFKLTDCNKSPNKLVHVNSVHLSNVDPLRIPGNETVSAEVQVLREISGMHYKLELTILKKLLFGYVIVPCFQNVANNTCVFELCDVLSGKSYATDPHHCPTEVSSTSPDFPCSCPFSPGTYRLNPVKFVIDGLPAYLKFLAQGDYKAHIKVTDTNTNEEVVCYDLQLSTGADCSGFSCLIGKK